MPTEQEVVDAIVLDEEVPSFVVEEGEKMRALFDIARRRRGARRDKAMDELHNEIAGKLRSQYLAYRGIITSLKVQATKKWIEEECACRVEVLNKSVERLHLLVLHWKRLYEEQVEANIKLKLATKGNGKPTTIAR